jgi:hypothetical protein
MKLDNEVVTENFCEHTLSQMLDLLKWQRILFPFFYVFEKLPYLQQYVL